MRKFLPAVGILLALLCAWLVYSQPTADWGNAGAASEVQEDRAGKPAAEIRSDELTAAELDQAAANLGGAEAESRRQAISNIPEGMAEIGVKVMVAKSSQAIMAIEVRAQRIGGIGSTFGDAIRPIESVRTSQNGEATLRVPAGAPLVISTGGPGMDSVILSPAGEVNDLEYELASQEIEALQPGEKINIALRLTEWRDLHWFQVVDGTSGALLPSARVLEPRMAEQDADEQARLFVAETNDYFGPPVVILGCEGYGPCRVNLKEGGTTAEQALRVELFRSASLQLTVLQNGLPLHNARIAMHYARTDGEILAPNRSQWGGKPRMAPFWGDTNEQGQLLLQGLPAHHPLVYGTSGSFGTDISQAAPGVITLQPGEQRHITWEVGQRQDLRGRTIDADGSPVHGAEVWLLNAQFQHGVEVDQANVTDWVGHYRIASASTNELGEFSFVEIHPGDYWLALAPTEDPAHLATARRVSVPPLTAPPFVELQYSSGAMVHGRCVTLTGDPLAGVEIFAMGMEGRATFQAQSQEDGRFEVGPFTAGSKVQFFVFHDSEGYQISDPVTAIAGDGQEVILRMAQGGTIRGRTVNDADGKPIDIGVTISSLEAGGASGTTSGPRGVFDWSGLAPGTWRVIAKNKSGWVGVSQPIVLTAAGTVEDVEVRVSPGGTLVVESEGEAAGTLRLSFEGWTVDFITIGPGERQSISVPLGVIEITLLNGDPEPPSVGKVTVLAGKVETFLLKSDS
jgi:hypothetical protein